MSSPPSSTGRAKSDPLGPGDSIADPQRPCTTQAAATPGLPVPAPDPGSAIHPSSSPERPRRHLPMLLRSRSSLCPPGLCCVRLGVRSLARCAGGGGSSLGPPRLRRRGPASAPLCCGPPAHAGRPPSEFVVCGRSGLRPALFREPPGPAGRGPLAARPAGLWVAAAWVARRSPPRRRGPSGSPPLGWGVWPRCGPPPRCLAAGPPPRAGLGGSPTPSGGPGGPACRVAGGCCVGARLAPAPGLPARLRRLLGPGAGRAAVVLLLAGGVLLRGAGGRSGWWVVGQHQPIVMAWARGCCPAALRQRGRLRRPGSMQSAP